MARCMLRNGMIIMTNTRLYRALSVGPGEETATLSGVNECITLTHRLKVRHGIFLAVCLLLLGGEVTTVVAATYFVSATGDDLNAGSETFPWRTIHKAAATVAAGDVVLVSSGIYEGAACTVSRSGSADAPITFRAVGPATNLFYWDLDKSYIILDGFVHEGGGLVYIRRSASHITVTNCTLKNALHKPSVSMDSPRAGEPQSGTAKNCRIVKCVFDHLTNLTAIDLQGVGHLVESNVIQNLYACDAFRLFGSNVVIRGNVISNVTHCPGVGNHPDIMQTFGDNGHWMVDYVFECNRVVNCPVQLMQMAMTRVPEPEKWGIVLRNNIFEHSNMQCSIDIPNVHFYDNTFYRCSNGGALLAFAFYDPGAPGWRGAAYGCRVLNNAFVECSGAYAVVYGGPAQGPLTPEYAGGGNRSGNGYAWLKASHGVIQVWSTYRGLSGSTTSATIFVVGGKDLYTIDGIGASGFTNELVMVEGAGGYSIAAQWGTINGNKLGLKINTSTFPGGEISGPLLGYVPNPPADLVADYNFTSKPGGAALKRFGEPHGINGGDPGFIAPEAGNYHLRSDSILIGRGTSVSSVTEDFEGRTRPDNPSIGAFERPSSVALRPPPIEIQTTIR